MDLGCLATSYRCGCSRQTGGEPCGDMERYSVCLVFLNGADLCVNCYKVMLCNSSGECPNSDISRLLLSGYDISVVLYVRRLIHSTEKECWGSKLEIKLFVGLFRQATHHIWHSPDSGGEASYS